MKNNSSLSKKRQAFTLIELLIVIAIIGILFIVLVSKVDFATDKAKATGVQTDFRSFQMAFETVAREQAGFSSLVDGDDYSKLEDAINKNLDSKLNVVVTDGNIIMANSAKDPWGIEYHGTYIAGDDGKDRGCLIMYSNGANFKFGSEATIAGGVANVFTTNNDGKDDYSMSVVYSLKNGYGEVKTDTSGFIPTILPTPPFKMEFNIPLTFKDDITLSDIADVYESCINKSDETIVYQSNTDMIGIMHGDLGDGNSLDMLVHINIPESGNPIGMNIYVPKEFLDMLEASGGDIGMDISEGWNFVDLSNLNNGSPTTTIIESPVIIFDETGEFNTTSGIDDLKPLFGSSCQHDMRLLNTIQPTCTEIGYENHRCSKCYQVYIKNRTQPLGHEYDSNHLCIRCGSLREKVTGEIMDTWDEIISYVNDGSYLYRYAIGAWKPLQVGTTTVRMSIASMVGDGITTDDDVASNETSQVHITWVGSSWYSFDVMNDEKSNSGGWAQSDLRAELQNVVFEQFPTNVKNAIITVKKTSYGSVATDDNLWVPSSREMNCSGYESSGPIYAQRYPDKASRKMNHDTYTYWLRGTESHDGFRQIHAGDGSHTCFYSNWSALVVFGFCI